MCQEAVGSGNNSNFVMTLLKINQLVRSQHHRQAVHVIVSKQCLDESEYKVMTIHSRDVPFMKQEQMYNTY